MLMVCKIRKKVSDLATSSSTWGLTCSGRRWTTSWIWVWFWVWCLIITQILKTMTNPTILINPFVVNVLVLADVIIRLKYEYVHMLIDGANQFDFGKTVSYVAVQINLTVSPQSKLFQIISSSSLAVPCRLIHIFSPVSTSLISSLNSEQQPP